jgi:hypothetical protein
MAIQNKTGTTSILAAAKTLNADDSSASDSSDDDSSVSDFSADDLSADDLSADDLSTDDLSTDELPYLVSGTITVPSEERSRALPVPTFSWIRYYIPRRRSCPGRYASRSVGRS